MYLYICRFNMYICLYKKWSQNQTESAYQKTENRRMKKITRITNIYI